MPSFTGQTWKEGHCAQHMCVVRGTSSVTHQTATRRPQQRAEGVGAHTNTVKAYMPRRAERMPTLPACPQAQAKHSGRVHKGPGAQGAALLVVVAGAVQGGVAKWGRRER
jgi:hypothetical protein